MFPVIYREMATHNRMTIKELAAKIGVTPKTLGAKLSGKSPFTLVEMRNIQQIFGLALEELFAQSTHTNPPQPSQTA